MEPTGANCKQCLDLSRLHSTAVDFIKTGVPATFPPYLRTKLVPSFMGNKYKDSYDSQKVLGHIHRLCESKLRKTSLKKTPAVLEPALLVPGFELYVADAYNLMAQYNEDLWQLMLHYGVMDEAELLSGCATKFSRKVFPKGGRGLQEVQERLNKKVKYLVQQYRNIFWDSLEDIRNRSEEALLGCGILVDSSSSVDGTGQYEMHKRSCEKSSMQQASAWYYCAYSADDDPHYGDCPKLYSFPWIVFDELCRIKHSYAAGC